MIAHPCALRVDTEYDARNVAEVAAHQASQDAPLLAWAEPDPLHVALGKGAGRREDFLPLQRGAPSWPADLPLIEARLFWPTTALHIIACEDGGCRWTRIEEVTADNETLMVMRSQFPVHTLRDAARFGFSAQKPIEGFRAIEYRQRGRLVAWRLIAGAV
jgi:hypothetical protein